MAIYIYWFHCFRLFRWLRFCFSFHNGIFHWNLNTSSSKLKHRRQFWYGSFRFVDFSGWIDSFLLQSLPQPVLYKSFMDEQCQGQLHNLLLVHSEKLFLAKRNHFPWKSTLLLFSSLLCQHPSKQGARLAAVPYWVIQAHLQEPTAGPLEPGIYFPYFPQQDIALKCTAQISTFRSLWNFLDFLEASPEHFIFIDNASGEKENDMEREG